MTDVTVVVPWRPSGSAGRDDAYRFVRRWWSDRWWPLVEAVPPDGPWNKADAINQTAALLDGVLVIADADVWCEGVLDAVQAVEAGAPWAVPHKRVNRLNRRATRAVIDGRANASDFYYGNGLAERPYLGVPGGGMLVVTAEALARVPFDPRFEGWGQEDESWGHAATLLLGRPWRGNAALWHLWHEPPPRLNRRWGSPQGRHLGRRYRAARSDPAAMAMLVDEARALAVARHNEQRVVAVPPANDESRG